MLCRRRGNTRLLTGGGVRSARRSRSLSRRTCAASVTERRSGAEVAWSPNPSARAPGDESRQLPVRSRTLALGLAPPADPIREIAIRPLPRTSTVAKAFSTCGACAKADTCSIYPEMTVGSSEEDRAAERIAASPEHLRVIRARKSSRPGPGAHTLISWLMLRCCWAPGHHMMLGCRRPEE